VKNYDGTIYTPNIANINGTLTDQGGSQAYFTKLKKDIPGNWQHGFKSPYYVKVQKYSPPKLKRKDAYCGFCSIALGGITFACYCPYQYGTGAGPTTGDITYHAASRWTKIKLQKDKTTGKNKPLYFNNAGALTYSSDPGYTPSNFIPGDPLGGDDR